MELIDSGRGPGGESLEDVIALNHQILNNLTAAFVFVAHAVPSFAVGDLLVSTDGASHQWTLATSKFIAFLDEHFDYKHERESVLEKVRAERWTHAVDA